MSVGTRTAKLLARLKAAPVELPTTRTRSARRDEFFGGAAAFTSGVVADCEGMAFVVDTTDTAVGRRLFIKRKRAEFEMLARTLATLAATGGPGPEGTVFVDVGANIGTSTIPAVVRHGFASALAFEPEPRNQRLLAANAALNGVAPRVRIVEAAASRRPGRAVLRLHDSNSGGHSLGSADGHEGVEVPLVTVDDQLAAEGIDPGTVGLLWIDAQGHDIDALAGARSLTARRCPVVLELSAKDLGGKGAELLTEALRGYEGLVDLRADGTAHVHRHGIGAAEVAPLSELTAFVGRFDGEDGRRRFTDILAF